MTIYKPNYSRSQSEAYKILETQSSPKLPVSVKLLINSFENLHMQTYQKFCQSRHITMTEVYSLLKSEDGALWYQRTTNEYIILYNSAKPKTRIRFTLAHELGHYILKHNEHTDETILSRYTLPNSKYESFEQEANYFARRLLVPLPVIQDIIWKNTFMKTEEIRKIFNVSFEVASYAVKDFEKASQWGYLDVVHDRITKRYMLFCDSIVNSTLCSHCFYKNYITNNFCSICGTHLKNSRFVFTNKNGVGGKNMNYSEISVDQWGKAYKCPRCANEDLDDGEFCSICGTFLINRCTGEDENYFDPFEITNKEMHELQGCQPFLDGNARYCNQCGSASTFYASNLLKSYTQELNSNSEKENSSTEDLFNDDNSQINIDEKDLPF